MPSTPDPRLPVLPFLQMRPGRRFGPTRFEVTEDLVRAYVSVTGDHNPVYRDPGAAVAAGLDAPVMPAGLAGVWARRSYLASHRMLPGGVMAGQDLEFRGPVTVGETLELTAEVAEMDPADPRRRVLLACAAADAAGRTVGSVRIDARWPEAER